MASTTLAFLAIAVLLLQAPWCAVGQQPPAAGRSAEMALTSFEGGTTACEGLPPADTALLAAVSKQNGDLCHKRIRITSTVNQKVAVAEVVDSCDDAHIIATSKAVWEALDLNTDAGEASITWTEVN